MDLLIGRRPRLDAARGPAGEHAAARPLQALPGNHARMLNRLLRPPRAADPRSPRSPCSCSTRSACSSSPIRATPTSLRMWSCLSAEIEGPICHDRRREQPAVAAGERLFTIEATPCAASMERRRRRASPRPGPPLRARVTRSARRKRMSPRPRPCSTMPQSRVGAGARSPGRASRPMPASTRLRDAATAGNANLLVAQSGLGVARTSA